MTAAAETEIRSWMTYCEGREWNLQKETEQLKWAVCSIHEITYTMYLKPQNKIKIYTWPLVFIVQYVIHAIKFMLVRPVNVSKQGFQYTGDIKLEIS